MWKPFEEEISDFFFLMYVGYLENYPVGSIDSLIERALGKTADLFILYS